ncbi:MAG: protein phosphatase 2C domain-containing protein [Rhodospirillales bacterium]
MSEAWLAASRSIQGGRDYQEDKCAVTTIRTEQGQAAMLAVLADGMGGHAGGAVASEIAVQRFAERFQSQGGETAERLRQSLIAANEAIAHKSQNNPDLLGMGCTLVGLVARQGQLDWVSVGDSPLWLYSNGALQRLNEDHSMMPVLQARVDRGELSAVSLSTHPARNALRSAVVGEDIPLVDLATMPLKAGADDILVLASDGMCSLSDPEIAAILRGVAKAEPQEIADKLVEAIDALGLPDQDNTTVVVLRPGKA